MVNDIGAPPASVLQVNVRLSEGGAAGVARILADGLRERGVRSQFAYGYSKGGRVSPLESGYEGIRVTPGYLAAGNRLSHLLTGEETRLRSPAHWARLVSAIDQADVVHLHAVHSHMAQVASLVQAITDARKPLVWTLHDQWLFTGRCAQPGACRRWESGCKRCPDLRAYPPAVLDFANRHWAPRRELLAEARRRVPVAVVACADWLGEEAERGGLGPVTTITNSVDRDFWDETGRLSSEPEVGLRTCRALFVCRDLRDERKVDWTALREIARLDGVSLTIVGDHSRVAIPGVNQMPAISDRRGLARVMAANDVLVFFSRVDYFPLTIAEAIVAGLQVVAVDSRAAREFSKAESVQIVAEVTDVVERVRRLASDGGARGPKANRRSFDPDVMVDRYVGVYSGLMARP
ncbi:putative glycosyl transferase [mine drainage metagenome]|uniref:Putative glycosyl transferase n=1 Tax=mine drainage metagenome TaxID=410659 RepID=A0A1J5QUV3_9ZZZZ